MLTPAQSRLQLEKLVDGREDALTLAWDVTGTFDAGALRQALDTLALAASVEDGRVTLTLPHDRYDERSLDALLRDLSALYDLFASQDASTVGPWSPPTRIAPEFVSDDLDAAAVEWCALPRATATGRLAAFVTLVQRHAGTRRITIGVTVPTAGHGAFDPLLPLTIDDADDTAAALDRLRRHAAIPFDRLLAILRPERVPRQHPLFEITFTPGSARAMRLGEAIATPVDVAPPRARHDLELTAGEDRAVLIYRSAFWPRAWAQALLEQYALLVREPRARVSAALEPAPAPPAGLQLTTHEARARIARAIKPKPLDDVPAVVFTGEPPGDALLARWRAVFPSTAPLYTLYEGACVQRVGDPPRRGVQPIGRPLAGTGVRVVTSEDEDCATGEIGALVIRGTPTGDRARVRSDGAIELCGRTDRRAWIGGALVDLDAVERERGETVVVETGVDGEARIRPARPPKQHSFVAPRDPVELQLARMWEELLAHAPVGATDDFFVRGGDSIAAIELIARVRDTFGIALEPSVLLPDATIEHLAHVIRHTRAPDPSPLVVIQRGNGASPLVCVHPSGGSILCYVDLARLLGTDRAVFGLKGPDPRSPEAPPQQASETAARYVDALRAAQPRGPYTLAGYSFGGLIAYEMAQQLTRAGQDVALVALLDTRFPRVYGAGEVNPVVDLGEVLERYDLDSVQADEGQERELWRELLELSQRYIPAETRRGRGLSAVQEFCRLYRLMPAADDLGYHDLRRFLRNLRANFRTMRDYVPRPSDVRVVLFAATQTVDGKESDHRRNASLWSDVAPGLDVRTIEASHFNLLAPPAVQTLATAIRELLP